MSKQALQKTKNLYNKGKDLSIKGKEAIDKTGDRIDSGIDKLRKSLLAKLGIANVLCSTFPSTNISSIVEAAKESLRDVIKFLIELLISLLDINLEKMQKLLSKWLALELNIFSSEITYTLRNNLNSCYLCKINPNVPDWLIENGINIEIKQIDFQGMFNIHPDSQAGKFIYGGDEDMNRTLFNAIRNGSSAWKYNGTTIATFTFKEQESDSFVGYDGSLDDASVSEKGKQNTDARNNVINMKIAERYQGQPLINFVTDYINSQAPVIISYKQTIPNIMDLKYGLVSRLGNLSIDQIRKKAEFNAALTELFEQGAENPDIKIDNSFDTFDREQLDSIEVKTNEMKTGVVDYSNCCCGLSSINDDELISFNDNLQKATEKNEIVSIIDGGLSKIANDSVNTLPETDKGKGYIEFFIDFIKNIGVIITSMVLSPKINILIVMLHYMVNKSARFVNVKEFLRSIICVIRDIMFGILKKLIYGLLIPQLINELSDIIKCAIKAKIDRRVEEELKSLESLLPKFQDPQRLLAIKKALNDVSDIGTGLANEAIDVGFDSANNSISEARDANKGG
jgi:hypothetical protein